MRILLLVLLSLIIPGCYQQPTPRQAAQRSASAIALNDSAMTLFLSAHGDTTTLNRALVILDLAIDEDSLFRTAYWNKVALLASIGQRSEAMATVDEWLNKRPDDSSFIQIRARITKN